MKKSNRGFFSNQGAVTLRLMQAWTEGVIWAKKSPKVLWLRPIGPWKRRRLRPSFWRFSKLTFGPASWFIACLQQTLTNMAALMIANGDTHTSTSCLKKHDIITLTGYYRQPFNPIITSVDVISDPQWPPVMTINQNDWLKAPRGQCKSDKFTVKWVGPTCQ